MAYTIAQLTTLIRRRCDIENSTQQVDAEILQHINDAAAYVHDFLISVWGENYAVAFGSLSTVAGTSTYSLASLTDFYLPFAVKVTVDNFSYPIGSFSLIRTVTRSQSESWGPGYLPRYSIIVDSDGTSNIIFDPAPDAVVPVTIAYNKSAPTYISSDTVDIPFPDLLVMEACIRVKDKEERDATRFMQERILIQKRIEDWIGTRDMGEPKMTLRAKKGGRSFWRLDGGRLF